MPPKKKDPKPTTIQLPHGVKFHAVVLQVVEEDPDGSPRTFRLLRDDESVKLEGGEKFWVVYGPEELKKKARSWN